MVKVRLESTPFSLEYITFYSAKSSFRNPYDYQKMEEYDQVTLYVRLPPGKKDRLNIDAFVYGEFEAYQLQLSEETQITVYFSEATVDDHTIPLSPLFIKPAASK